MEKRGETTTDDQVGMHAVLVGCNNYPDPTNDLTGCHNDVHMMRKALIERFRFDPKKIVVMIDNPGSENMPTGENIKKEVMKMVGNVREGDMLFFHFSGHGMYFRGDDGKIQQSIVPCDGNLITCMDFRHYVNRLPKNATFTIFADSCCSGGLIDKEPVQVGLPYHVPNPIPRNDDEYKPRMIPYETYLAQLSSKTGLNDPNVGVHLVHLFGSEACSLMFSLPPHQHPKPLHPDQGILLSGCEPYEFTYEAPKDSKDPCGAFTKAVVRTILMKGHPAPPVMTNKQLVVKARAILGNRKDDPAQHPCLYCSGKNAEAVFLGKASGRAEIGGTSAQDHA